MASVRPFNQPPPELGNQYDDDRVLRSYIARLFSSDALDVIEDELRQMGELAGGELYRLQLADRPDEPRLTQWDAWGNRVDRIELTRVWQVARRIAAEKGLVAAAYEQKHGWRSRPYQLALAYLFHPSTDTYGCPLAMTDGAARTLLDSGQRELVERAVPRLTSRDPQRMWTSGQWMTESTGGSDVGQTQTAAVRGEDGRWHLWGRKWFTSAATSDMALTLARPQGNPPEGRGLAMFYLETYDEHGRRNDIRVHRLKDKLGTRKLPTAELALDGTPADLVGETTGGVRAITPMLNITRTWNGVIAVSEMRRGLALARDYARRRVAFGAPLSDKPLHLDTLAGLQAEFEGAFHLAFYVGELLGRSETGELDEQQANALRMAIPVMKLLTAKQAVAMASEVLEAFGGAGYVEDTGLPALLRDAQVLPIWEGTTNVLALDTLRALSRADGLGPLEAEMDGWTAEIRDPQLTEVARTAGNALRGAARWWTEAHARGPETVEAGARRFALTVGRALELGLLACHAQWALDHEGDARPRAAALRLAAHGVDRTRDMDETASRALANDAPLADRSGP